MTAEELKFENQRLRKENARLSKLIAGARQRQREAEGQRRRNEAKSSRLDKDRDQIRRARRAVSARAAKLRAREQQTSTRRLLLDLAEQLEARDEFSAGTYVRAVARGWAHAFDQQAAA